MQIPKEQIVQFLQSQGQHDKAQQAQQEAPDQVDTEHHGDLLSKLGIDPQQLLGMLGGLGGGGGGGIGGMLGKLGGNG